MSDRKPLANTCAIMVSSHRMPAETCSPWQPDQRKERRQERAARRTRAVRDEIGELASFKREKAEAKDTGQRHRDLEKHRVAGIGRDAGKTAGKTRGQQQSSLDGDIAQIEQIVARRPARGLPVQHGVGGKERREHDHVAEDEDPETVAGDDPLGRGAVPAAVAPAMGCRRRRSSERSFRATSRGVRSGCGGRCARLRWPEWCPHPRRARRTRQRWRRRRSRRGRASTRYARSAQSP